MSVIKFGKDLPSFVKKFREDMNWSQEDLAKQLGCHGQYVSNVERRQSKSSISFASRLLPIVGKERKPYLIDLIAEESSQKAVQRLKTKAKERRR